MNYFELYNLPVNFMPDKQQVSHCYFELQKKYHPDFFANAADDEKEEALELSALANKAYKTFQNRDTTIKYVLQLKGLLQEEEKYTLPPAFLMEVMELNELKMDGADEAEVKARTAALQTEIDQELQPLLRDYQDGTSPEAHLLQIKEGYYKLKYLTRLQ